MSIYLRCLLVVISVLSMLNILKRIRRYKLQIEYSIFWIFFSVILIVIAIFPQITYKIAKMMGIQSPANMVFLIVIFVLMFKVFYLTLEVSQLQYKVKELVQKIAIDENETREKDEK